MTTKPSVQDCRALIIEVRKNRAFDPQEFGRRLAEYVDAKKVRKHPTVRVGDFDATPESGNFYLVKCRKCGLAGRLALPDDCNRNRCPRCLKLDVSEWQRKGFGSLLAPEKKSIKFIMPVSIESQELDEPETEPEIVEVEHDNTVDLSLSESAVVAGEDAPESEIEPELTGDEEVEVA